MGLAWPLLHTAERQVGVAWNATIALGYADESLGWVACDNLLQQLPLEPIQNEVMKLLADTALYLAKNQGRNRVSLATLG